MKTEISEPANCASGRGPEQFVAQIFNVCLSIAYRHQVFVPLSVYQR